MNKPDASKQREIECIPVAMAILKTLATHEDLFMGSQKQADLDEFFKTVFSTEVEPIIRTANIKTADMSFIFQLIQQVIGNIQRVMVDGINDAFDSVVAVKLGLKDVGDVRIADLVKAQLEAVAKLSPPDASAPITPAV